MSRQDNAINIYPEFPSHAEHNDHRLSGPSRAWPWSPFTTSPIIRPGPSRASAVAPPGKPISPDLGTGSCLGNGHAYPVSILLEFLEDLPEPREAGLSHAEHSEPAPHLPEVGGPTALQGAQHVHLLGHIPHQEVAALAGESHRGHSDDAGTATDKALSQAPEDGEQGAGVGDMVLRLSTDSWEK